MVMTEDQIKDCLRKWLEENGWTVRVAPGHVRGIDIEAAIAGRRRIIEVKGSGSRPQMRVNFFLAVLGEILQRMNDHEAMYSIAMPDLPQYRSLWQRLPHEAKARIKITAFFVNEEGKAYEVSD